MPFRPMDRGVVYGKVSDFMIPCCCASMGFLEVGHLVVVDGGNLVVDAYELFRSKAAVRNALAMPNFALVR